MSDRRRTCCAALNCSNRGGFKFPKDPVVKKKWINALKRKKFVPSSSSVICKDHFIHEDVVTQNAFGQNLLRTKLKPGAVPCKFQVDSHVLHQNELYFF